MGNSHSKIAIVSGEISGDQYASLLASNLKKFIPSLEIIGTGGPKLENSGIRIIAKNPLSGAFGISSVIRNLSQHVKFLNKCAFEIKKEKPDLVIFIDNPTFNLNLAKRLPEFRKIYYIPPKIWAHGYQRIFLIGHLFESVIVIFPFEKELYEKEGIPVEYFGHPAVDLVNQVYPEDLFEKTGIRKDQTIIGLFPGSRKEEVQCISPLLIKAGKIIQKNHNNVAFVVSSADEKLYPVLKKILEKEKLEWVLWRGSAHTIARQSHIALAASGTMNLELALLGTPMIVFYRMTRIDYIIARIIVQLHYASPVNIIHGKKIVEEFIQNVNWYRFQRVFSNLFEGNSEKRKNQIEQFRNLKTALGEEKVTEKIAYFILQKI